MIYAGCVTRRKERDTGQSTCSSPAHLRRRYGGGYCRGSVAPAISRMVNCRTGGCTCASCSLGAEGKGLDSLFMLTLWGLWKELVQCTGV
jgi:hypothetical protein